MSGINWNVVNAQANNEAHDYAIKTGHQKSTPIYCERFNAYHAGRMKCASERESLRIIAENTSKAKVTSTQIIHNETITIDDLI